MKLSKALQVMGGLVIAGGIGVSLVQIVAKLMAQAFEQVASAGKPGLIGLFVGGMLMWLGHLLGSVGKATRPGSSHGSAAGGGGIGIIDIIGWLALLGGSGWAALAVMFMGLDAPESTLTLLLAAPGALVAIVGLLMVLISGLSGSSRASR